MKVLVTGGSGFLGSWVAERLSARGDTVRALVRKSSNRSHLETLKNVEFAVGAVEDAQSVRHAADGVDAIIHSAGILKARSPAEFHKVNVEGTRNVVEAAKACGTRLRRLVLVSSMEATGPSPDGTPSPVTQATPVTEYGKSKLEGERVALAEKAAIPLTVLRPGAIYGPRDQEILDAFKSVKSGLMPTVAGGGALGKFIYGPDCADACIRAIEADVPSGSVFHVDDGSGAISQRQFLELIEQAVGKKALIRFSLPKGLLKTVSYGVQAFGAVTNRAVMLTPEKAEMLLMHWVGESSETPAALQWSPTTPLPAGLEQTVSWYRQAGWL